MKRPSRTHHRRACRTTVVCLYGRIVAPPCPVKVGWRGFHPLMMLGGLSHGLNVVSRRSNTIPVCGLRRGGRLEEIGVGQTPISVSLVSQ